MDAVSVHNLGKTYTYHHKAAGFRGSLVSLVRREQLQKLAVDDVSFSIASGEMVGFLGPNGAGKTTTLKMLCGLLYPSAGEAAVLGHTPHRRERRFLRQIALVMGQKNMLWWDLPTMETLLLHRDMYDVPEREFRRTVADLSEMLEVVDLLDVQVRKLSLGERMKMELLAALVHNPSVLFLDEPTIGLDVVSQQRVRDFLRTLNRERGTTVLLTSHYMDDIEQLCSSARDRSRTAALRRPARSLVEQAAPKKIVRAVYFRPVSLGALRDALGDLTPAEHYDPLRVSVEAPRDQAAHVAASLIGLGAVADLAIEEAPIEDVVRRMFVARALEAAR
ncbi:MAG: ATP-binding cassette domain-containing protein [Chloroflexia bacterium]